MSKCMEEEKRAVDCGYWPLYRFNPALKAENKNPFILDSKTVNADFQEFLMGENRFSSLKKAQPNTAERLFAAAEKESKNRLKLYQKLSEFFQTDE